MTTEIAVLFCIAGGLASGLLAGLLGIGGGLVVMPLLYACLPALGIADAALPEVAVATALAVMLPTTLSATWAQHRRGAIDWPWAARMAPATLVGSAAGALLATQLQGKALSLLFIAYASWCGLRMLLPAARVAAPALPLPAGAALMPGAPLALLVGGLGASAGLGSALIVVPCLLRRGLQMKHAVANSTVLNLLVSASGLLSLSLPALLLSAQAGPTQWLLAAGIGVGAVLGAPCGVALSHRLPVAQLRCGFGLVTLSAGAGMLIHLSAV